MSASTRAPELSLGDRVWLRRPHACGSGEFEVVGLGADIRLRCVGCGHRVLLDRLRMEGRLRRHLPAADVTPPAPAV